MIARSGPPRSKRASALGVAYIFQWVHDPNIRLYWTLIFTFIHYYINTSTLIGLPPCLPLQEPYYCTLAQTFMSMSSIAMFPFIHHNYLLPSEWTSQRQKKITLFIYHAHLLFPRQGLAASCMMRLMSEILLAFVKYQNTCTSTLHLSLWCTAWKTQPPHLLISSVVLTTAKRESDWVWVKNWLSWQITWSGPRLINKRK